MFTWNTKKSILKAIVTKNSPFYIQFFVSKYCHLTCKMCNIVEAEDDVTPFDNAHIEKIADNLVKIGAGVVLLTGGEPLLRPDLDQIVKIFKERNLDVRMQTAGLMKKRALLASCVEYGARDINISLDSLDEEMSDYINGKKGSWRDAIKMISYASRTFPSKDSVCALGCVLSPYNIDEIDAMLDFSTEIGWWLSLVPAHITDERNLMDFSGYDDYFSFTQKDVARLEPLIVRLKEKKREGYTLFDSDDYLDSIVEYASTGRPSWRRNGVCDSPNLYFAILPDGSFAPCCSFRLPGEKIYVYSEDFPEFYRNPSFRKEIKEKVAGRCTGCNFGSYPEMTLAVRSLNTLKERIILQMKTKTKGMRALSENELFEIIEGVKNRHTHIYENRQYRTREQKKWPQADNVPKRLWNDESSGH